MNFNQRVGESLINYYDGYLRELKLPVLTITVVDVETVEKCEALVNQLHETLKRKVIKQITIGTITLFTSLAYTVLVLKVAFRALASMDRNNPNKDFSIHLFSLVLLPGLIGIGYSIYLIGQGILGLYHKKHRINYAKQVVSETKRYFDYERLIIPAVSLKVDLGSFNPKKGKLGFVNGLEGQRSFARLSHLSPEVKEAFFQALRQHGLASTNDYIYKNAITAKDEEWKVIDRKIEDDELLRIFHASIKRKNPTMDEEQIQLQAEDRLRELRRKKKHTCDVENFI